MMSNSVTTATHEDAESRHLAALHADKPQLFSPRRVNDLLMWLCSSGGVEDEFQYEYIHSCCIINQISKRGIVTLQSFIVVAQ